MTYIIKTGDTLSKISRKLFGTAARWPEIWAANNNTLRSGNPNLIYPGETLIISGKLPPAGEQITTLAPPLSSDSVDIFIAGKKYDGWESVSITSEINAIADQFSLTIAGSPIPNISPFESALIQISAYSEILLTGTIERIATSLKSDSHGQSLSGRSLAGTLIDSSITGIRSWENSPIASIFSDICTQFGITARIESDAIISAEANYGEKAGAFLQKIAKEVGLIITSVDDGAIQVAKFTSAPPVEIIDVGSSTISAINSEYNLANKYQSYTVARQTASSDEEATSIDSSVSIPRKNARIAATDTSSLQNAADWNNRRGSRAAEGYLAVFPRWTTPGGNLYRKGNTIKLSSAENLIEENTFIIDKIVYTLSANSRGVTMTILPQGAYD